MAQTKKPGRDLGMLGVLVHVVGDAINNIGVIIAAVIIWQTRSEARFYADPAASMFIAIMIFISSIPLTKNSGAILLESAPRGVEIDDVKHDLEQVRVCFGQAVAAKTTDSMPPRSLGLNQFMSCISGGSTSKKPLRPPTSSSRISPCQTLSRRPAPSTSVCMPMASTRRPCNQKRLMK